MFFFETNPIRKHDFLVCVILIALFIIVAWIIGGTLDLFLTKCLLVLMLIFARLHASTHLINTYMNYVCLHQCMQIPDTHKEVTKNTLFD